MWLAHELDVLTAICTPIKIGGERKECTAVRKEKKKNWNARIEKLAFWV